MKLNIEMSWWAMIGLVDRAGNERSDEEKVALIAENGFDGINGSLPAEDDIEAWMQLLAKHHLSFSLNAYPASIEDLKDFVEKAKRVKSFGFINTQVMQPFMIGDTAIEFLKGIDQLSAETGIPIFVETHRGTITQDLIRTTEYVAYIPSLMLTIDYSHYVVAGEMHTISQEAEIHLQSLLNNASSIHTRISNGEQVQIDPGEKRTHPMLIHFIRWWRAAMHQWLRRAEENDIFPVVIELGPPAYAITTDEAGARSHEISDRWQQSLYLKKLIEELWQEELKLYREG